MWGDIFSSRHIFLGGGNIYVFSDEREGGILREIVVFGCGMLILDFY